MLTMLLGTLMLSAQTVYDFEAKDAEGRMVALSNYRGQVLLIVNTATRCGFTPQYKELEALYEKLHGAGLEILDFPCNQFGQQAPGSILEIRQFCTEHYAVQFPQFDKIDVNGDGELPLYTFLKAQKGFEGFDLNNPIGKRLDEMFSKKNPNYAQSADIKWNFTKFLISADGHVLKRYEPTAPIDGIEQDVLEALKK